MKSPKPATDNRIKKYIKSYLWNRTMLKILKMATGINFSMSRINSGHHNLHTYEMSLKSDNDEFVQNCGGHFENGDRYKFFDVGNQFGTSLSTHISNFDIGQCWIFAVLWRPFWKWRQVEIFQCRDIIIYPHIKFWWYRTMLNFYRPFFMPCFGSHFENFETQNWSSNGDLLLCQILFLYHYPFRSYQH
jgi:hypothetical protein